MNMYIMMRKFIENIGRMHFWGTGAKSVRQMRSFYISNCACFFDLPVTLTYPVRIIYEGTA